MSNFDKVAFYTNYESLSPDFLEVARLFLPYSEFSVSESFDAADMGVFISVDGHKCSVTAKAMGKEYQLTRELLCCTELTRKRYLKRYSKVALYRALSEYFNISMPWGSLTGIRPTKLAYELGGLDSGFEEIFKSEFDVSPDKISLIKDTLNTQNGLLNNDERKVNLYIGIPFCTSRCSYCSFTSGVISKLSKHIQPYLENLEKEIKWSLGFLKENDYRLGSVYIGGGTPTSLDVDQLKMILDCIDFKPEEFTVEAGRPDTITREKLAVMKEKGVERVSINPQSFSQQTLDRVGRSHTISDIKEKYLLARDMGFVINMDLIAGLPGEDYETFVSTIKCAVDFVPHNITVHTLTLKRGSELKEQSKESVSDESVSKMVEFARSYLKEHGYMPYYLYRQKYMSQNLENVGYSLDGYACRYNIDIMEETTSIMACGCNAISKRVYMSQGRIERAANPKDVITYNNDLEKLLNKKRELFK